MENRLIHRRVLPGMLCALFVHCRVRRRGGPSMGIIRRQYPVYGSGGQPLGRLWRKTGHFGVYLPGLLFWCRRQSQQHALLRGGGSGRHQHRRVELPDSASPAVLQRNWNGLSQGCHSHSGGNDLYSVVKPDGSVDLAAIPGMLQGYGGNLYGILTALTAMSSDVKVYVGNLYDPKIPIPGSGDLIIAMNQLMAQTVSAFPGKVVLVDIHKAFQGRYGLLLNERRGVDPTEIHPTDLGYGVMAAAFADAIGKK